MRTKRGIIIIATVAIGFGAWLVSRVVPDAPAIRDRACLYVEARMPCRLASAIAAFGLDTSNCEGAEQYALIVTYDKAWSDLSEREILANAKRELSDKAVQDLIGSIGFIEDTIRDFGTGSACPAKTLEARDFDSGCIMGHVRDDRNGLVSDPGHCCGSCTCLTAPCVNAPVSVFAGTENVELKGRICRQRQDASYCN